MDTIERDAFKIVEVLSQKGFKAYFAGGCVRDRLLGQPYKDIDIATSALPEDIIRIFKRTIPVGIQFGVIMVLMNQGSYEVATFRKDGEYRDGRRPETVEFTDEKEDVLRRSFTINGMLYDPIKNKIIDYVGGEEDLKKGIIKAIGDPYKRFEEDKLRMLRAIRFSARLSFEIEKKTWTAIKKYHREIIKVSAERIRDEIVKILTEGRAYKGFLLLDESGLLDVILPEITTLKGVQQPQDYHPEGDVFTHTMLLLKNLKNPHKELALAALFHDVGKPDTYSMSDRIRFNKHDKVGVEIAREICNRLKLSNNEKSEVLGLIGQHMNFMNAPKMRESKLKRFLRQENFPDHLELHRLDCIASHGKLDIYDFCTKKLEDFTTEDNSVLHPVKLIDGKKLMDLGFKPGPLFKTIIEEVENAQLEGKISTEKEAVDFIRSKFN